MLGIGDSYSAASGVRGQLLGCVWFLETATWLRCDGGGTQSVVLGPSVVSSEQSAFCVGAAETGVLHCEGRDVDRLIGVERALMCVV
jgi:hypothetical protein